MSMVGLELSVRNICESWVISCILCNIYCLWAPRWCILWISFIKYFVVIIFFFYIVFSFNDNTISFHSNMCLTKTNFIFFMIVGVMNSLKYLYQILKLEWNGVFLLLRLGLAFKTLIIYNVYIFLNLF